MEHKELIGRNLKQIRNRLGFKQKELAENLNISNSYLSEVESGKKNPGIEVVSKLLEIYQVNPMYLLTGDGECFLFQGKRKPGERHGKAKEGDNYNEMLDEMLWYLEHIPVIGYAVFEFFKSYMYEKRGMIEEEVKKIIEENPEEEIPGR